MKKLAHLLNSAGITYKEYIFITDRVKTLKDIKENEAFIRKNISLGKWEKFQKNFLNIDLEFKEMQFLGINILSIEDEAYPQNLKNIFEPPYILYYMGDVSLINRFCISIVGSRKPTAYGLFAARKFAKELAQREVVIVSGLALGVDTQAHKSALESNGKTIGILGTSFDNMYPRSNQTFLGEMVSSGNLVISEYPLNKKTMPYHFVQRNRLISGIGQGLVVIEAGEKSGTLTTVDFALEQGKNVFSVPGNIDSRNSIGTNNLIKLGAKPITKVEDILEDYPEFSFVKKLDDKESFSGFSAAEKRVLEILKFKGVQNIEKIAFFTNIKIKDIIGILNILEIKGVVKDLGNGMYSL